MLALTAPVFPLVSSDLAKWERFAQKGGIGSAVATKDQEQLDPSDLMFLQDDHIVVLLDLGHDRYLVRVILPNSRRSSALNERTELEPTVYTYISLMHRAVWQGYCEEIIGCFSGDSVAFTGKLKRPVLAARSPSLSTSSPVVAQMVPATGIPQYSNGESTRADDAKESLTELSEDIAEDFKSRRRRTNMAGLGIDVATMIARDQPWKNEGMSRPQQLRSGLADSRLAETRCSRVTFNARRSRKACVRAGATFTFELVLVEDAIACDFAIDRF